MTITLKETTPRNQRVYLVLSSDDSGAVKLHLSLAPPPYPASTMAVLITRGVLPSSAPVDVPLQEHPAVEELGTITLTEKVLVAVTLPGVRKLTAAMPGVKKGEALVLAPAGDLPSGYSLGNAIATAEGTIKVTLTAPPLAINASYSITARVIRLNT